MSSRPISVSEAYDAGLTWQQLQSRRWRRVAHGIYAGSRRRVTPTLLLEAIQRRLPAEAVFSGRTGAWLHGLDLPSTTPIEVTVPAGITVAHRAGVRFHKARLEPGEIVLRGGFRTTSVLRTCIDLGSGRDLAEAVVALDMALNASLISAEHLAQLTERWGGRHGVKRLRRAVALADRAESPMETRLRLLLIQAGLPRPATQVDLFGKDGKRIGRADLFYPSHGLCIEYDGRQHRDLLVEDDRRQNRIVEAGYLLLRFTAADVLTTPERVIALVREHLRRPPLPDFSRNPPHLSLKSPDFSRNPRNAEKGATPTVTTRGAA